MAEISIQELAQLQEGMTDDQKLLFSSQFSSEKKDRNIALILSFLLTGIDRIYVGDIGLGVAKILTLGGCGVWWFIDLFLIMGRADEVNRAKAKEIALIVKNSK